MSVTGAGSWKSCSSKGRTAPRWTYSTRYATKVLTAFAAFEAHPTRKAAKEQSDLLTRLRDFAGRKAAIQLSLLSRWS